MYIEQLCGLGVFGVGSRAHGVVGTAKYVPPVPATERGAALLFLALIAQCARNISGQLLLYEGLFGRSSPVYTVVRRTCTKLARDRLGSEYV